MGDYFYHNSKQRTFESHHDFRVTPIEHLEEVYRSLDAEIKLISPRCVLHYKSDKKNFGRVVVVADGGLNNDKNIAHIVAKNNGYIVSKSIHKSSKAIKKWALDEADFRWNPDRTFKVKSQIVARTIKDENGVESTIEEKVICFWSKAHYDKQTATTEKNRR